MINIEKIEVFGWQAAIRGMRNPMNSWENSDTCFGDIACYNCENHIQGTAHCSMTKRGGGRRIGPNDLNLMMRLRNAGIDHRKFMRMITVYLDITAPLYWWKEFDTYKVGTVANSCSTMHKIADKKFTLDDFSCEHLYAPLQDLRPTIDLLNMYREIYLETKDKNDWWQMIQLLPSSYNQKRTVMLNYEVLANIYKSRCNHKLDEWRELCKWVETLPYAKGLIYNDTEKE